MLNHHANQKPVSTASRLTILLTLCVLAGISSNSALSYPVSGAQAKLNQELQELKAKEDAKPIKVPPSMMQLKFPEATPTFMTASSRRPGLRTRKDLAEYVSRRRFFVPLGTKAVSLNKPITSSDNNPVIGTLKLITDNNTGAQDGSWVELAPGVQWVQIDLQEPHNIYALHLWHYHGESRIYRDVIVRVADDVEFKFNVRTLFNNDQDNTSKLGMGKGDEYYESYLGKLIDTRGKQNKGVKARYVRLYSRGNSSDEQNHYTEVLVYGSPVKSNPGGAKSGKPTGEPRKLTIKEDAKPRNLPLGMMRLKFPVAIPSFISAGSFPPPPRTEMLERHRENNRFFVPLGTKAVSLKKPVISSDNNPIIGSLEVITDNDIGESDGKWVELTSGTQWVQIDLQQRHNIYAIVFWHYYHQGRIYHDVIVRVADDASFKTNVRTLFNNDHDNSSGLGTGKDREYAESYLGKLVDTRGKDMKGITARYVRLYSHGNSSDEQNHYVEVLVYGTPV